MRIYFHPAALCRLKQLGFIDSTDDHPVRIEEAFRLAYSKDLYPTDAVLIKEYDYASKRVFELKVFIDELLDDLTLIVDIEVTSVLEFDIE